MKDTSYDDFRYDIFWRGREYEDRAEKIAFLKFLKIIKNRGIVIDIGGGFGRYAPLCAPNFKEYVIVEPSKELLEMARKKWKRFSNIKYVNAFAQNLPFEDDEFDVALFIRVIHHIEKPEEALKEIKRVLKPGGFLIIEVANKIHFLNRVRALLRGDFKFKKDLSPVIIKSKKKKYKNILIIDHHPQKIISILERNGFGILKVLSVSNFRLKLLKKIVPLRVLLFFENIFQSLLAKNFFGASIMILAKKKG